MSRKSEETSFWNLNFENLKKRPRKRKRIEKTIKLYSQHPMISESRYPHTHRVSSSHLRQQHSQRWRPIFQWGQTTAEKKKWGKKSTSSYRYVSAAHVLRDSKDAVGATPIDDAMIESEYSIAPLQISNETQVDTTDALWDTDSFVTIEELKNVTISVSTMRSSLYELRKWTIRDLEGCPRGQSSRHVNKKLVKIVGIETSFCIHPFALRACQASSSEDEMKEMGQISFAFEVFECATTTELSEKITEELTVQTS